MVHNLAINKPICAEHCLSLQNEAECQKDLDEQVKAIQDSLPSTNQPGFELVYITRSDPCDMPFYTCSTKPNFVNPLVAESGSKHACTLVH